MISTIIYPARLGWTQPSYRLIFQKGRSGLVDFTRHPFRQQQQHLCHPREMPQRNRTFKLPEDTLPPLGREPRFLEQLERFSEGVLRHHVDGQGDIRQVQIQHLSRAEIPFYRFAQPVDFGLENRAQGFDRPLGEHVAESGAPQAVEVVRDGAGDGAAADAAEVPGRLVAAAGAAGVEFFVPVRVPDVNFRRVDADDGT